MLVYLARHGETDANKERRIQGALLDPPLNETGQTQAERLANAIADLSNDNQVHAVYASPALRTRQTAAPIAAALYLDRVDFVPGLREVSWGEWDGSAVTSERGLQLRAIFDLWRQGNLLARAPSGESANDVIERTGSTMHALARLHKDETIVVVGHERCNKVLLSYLLHGGVAQMDHLHQPNGGLTILRENAGTWRTQVAPFNGSTPDVERTPDSPAADAQ